MAANKTLPLDKRRRALPSRKRVSVERLPSRIPHGQEAPAYNQEDLDLLDKMCVEFNQRPCWQNAVRCLIARRVFTGQQLGETELWQRIIRKAINGLLKEREALAEKLNSKGKAK